MLHLPRKTFTRLKPSETFPLFEALHLFYTQFIYMLPIEPFNPFTPHLVYEKTTINLYYIPNFDQYPFKVNPPHTLAPMQVPKKRPFNKALSMMDLDETIEDRRDCGRAPPCKRPRHVDEVLQNLASPDIVGDQTVPCQTYKHQK